MRRRPNICVHDPPCCYSLHDPGTDSSSELYVPRYKGYVKKKRAVQAPTVPKYYKRKETQPILKHYYPYFSTHKCSRISYDRAYPTTVVKERHKVKNFDEISTDAKSISEASHCTSALSVDVSCEMAAVNKEIETLLASYEKVLDENVTEEVEYKMRIQDKSKGQPKNNKKPNLSPEQIRLLSMERPPLEKLKDIPLEYLKPRQPTHIKEKLKQVQKSLNKKNQERKITPNVRNNDSVGKVSTNLTNSELNETKPSNSTTELLTSMWHQMVAQGLIPKNQEVGKTVKEICTSMEFDESSEVKIDLDGLSKMTEKAVSKMKITPSGFARGSNKCSSSVATQTLCDYDALLKKKTQLPRCGMGDADRSAVYYDDGKQETFGVQSKTLPKSMNSGNLSEVLNSLDGTIPFKDDPKPRVENLGKNIDQSMNNSMQIPSRPTEINVYTAQTKNEKYEHLRANLDNWIKSKTTEPTYLGENKRNFDNPLYHLASDQITSVNTETNNIQGECSKYFEPNPLSFLEKDRNKFEFSNIKKTQELQRMNIPVSEGIKETEKNSLIETKSSVFEVPNGFIVPQNSKLQSNSTLDNNSPKRSNSPCLNRLDSGIRVEKKENQFITESDQNPRNKYNTYHIESKPRISDQKSPINESSLVSTLESRLSSLHNCRPANKSDRLSRREEPESKEVGGSKSLVTTTTPYTSENTPAIILSDVRKEKLSKELVDSKHVHEVDPLSSEKPNHFNFAVSTQPNDNTELGVQTSDLSETKLSLTTHLLKKTEKHEVDLEKKENLDDLDSSICVGIIRKLIETMMKCEPGQIAEEISSGKNIMHHLKQLRSDHLKHIQTEVKHIEDLDRCLEDFDLTAQLLFNASRANTEKK